MSNEQNGEHEKPKTNRAFDYVLSALVFIASALTASIFSKNEPKQNTNDANYQIARWTAVVGRWTRWLVIVGVITAAVLAVQAIILINQLGEMRTDQRAWIAPIGARLNGELIAGQPINVLVDFANSGKEPALNVVNIASGAPIFLSANRNSRRNLNPDHWFRPPSTAAHWRSRKTAFQLSIPPLSPIKPPTLVMRGSPTNAYLIASVCFFFTAASAT